MKRKVSLGFTILELLVVISILGLLTVVVLNSLSLGQSQEERLRTKALVDKITYAVEAYYEKTSRYPEDLKAEGPALGTVEDDTEADPNFGYLAMLETGYLARRRTTSGNFIEEPLSFIDVDEEERIDGDLDHLQDVWGFKIQYRRCPLNVADFRARFNDNGNRDDVLGFPGNPKKFNVWSPGPDGEDEDQIYKQYDDLTTDGTEPYKSGGYEEGDVGDGGDDVKNW